MGTVLLSRYAAGQLALAGRLTREGRWPPLPPFDEKRRREFAERRRRDRAAYDRAVGRV
jgi:hypothetical protein